MLGRPTHESMMVIHSQIVNDGKWCFIVLHSGDVKTSNITLHYDKSEYFETWPKNAQRISRSWIWCKTSNMVLSFNRKYDFKTWPKNEQIISWSCMWCKTCKDISYCVIPQTYFSRLANEAWPTNEQRVLLCSLLGCSLNNSRVMQAGAYDISRHSSHTTCNPNISRHHYYYSHSHTYPTSNIHLHYMMDSDRLSRSVSTAHME